MPRKNKTPYRLTAALRTAAQRYIDLKARRVHPDGSFDKHNRFYLADEESHECCSKIKPPSRNFPFSYMLHARTMVHVATAFHIELPRLKWAVKRLSEQQEAEKITRTKDLHELALVQGRQDAVTLTPIRRFTPGSAAEQAYSAEVSRLQRELEKEYKGEAK